MARNLAASYQKVQVMTASPAQRVVLVYKAICKHLETAVSSFDLTDPGRFETINNSIATAEHLITELQLALDHEHGGEIATNLDRLYNYWRKTLSDANVQKNKEKIGTVLEMVKNLTEGWVEAEKSLRSSNVQPFPTA